MSDSISPSLSGAEWWRRDKTTLVAALREREDGMRRLQAEAYEILAEMQSRGAQAEFGYGSLDALQTDVLNISRREASKRSRRALALHPVRGVGSTVMPVAAPATAAAVAEGAISDGHVDALLDMVDGIRTDVPVVERDAYEKAGVDLARVTTPKSVRSLARELHARLDQDGTPPDERELREPQRELRTLWRRDGSMSFSGRVDAETARLFERLLSPLTKPRPTPEGERDPRGNAERYGDAFAELLDYAHRAGQLPAEAGDRPTVSVALDFNRLLDGLGTVALLNGSEPLTAEQVRRLACDAEVIPAVFGSHSEILDLGRGQRTVNRAQRRYLKFRDKGCVFVGCTRPAEWTQAHHIRHWIDLGPTDIANLCLLCSEHHRLIHHSEWDIIMAPDGHPECIPPKFIDPTQTPRRNYAHHHL